MRTPMCTMCATMQTPASQNICTHENNQNDICAHFDLLNRNFTGWDTLRTVFFRSTPIILLRPCSTHEVLYLIYVFSDFYFENWTDAAKCNQISFIWLNGVFLCLYPSTFIHLFLLYWVSITDYYSLSIFPPLVHCITRFVCMFKLNLSMWMNSFNNSFFSAICSQMVYIWHLKAIIYSFDCPFHFLVSRFISSYT